MYTGQYRAVGILAVCTGYQAQVNKRCLKLRPRASRGLGNDDDDAFALCGMDWKALDWNTTSRWH